MNTPTIRPTHIVVDMGGWTLAGCPVEDQERIRTILAAGLQPTELPSNMTLPGWCYFRTADDSTETI